MKRVQVLLFIISIIPLIASSQTVELVPFADFESWQVRNIKESAILGGNHTKVYAIAPNEVIEGAIPLKKTESQWASSNALAIVIGIVKTSNTLYPDYREDGSKCARMVTKVVRCQALGFVNISVIASGSMFLGSVIEPIRGASNPYGKLNIGIPFDRKPSAVMFDYKMKVLQDSIISTANGLRITEHRGKDYAHAFIFLQKRWEDEEGNLYAKRIGTARHLFGESSDGWVDGYQMPVKYGDITSRGDYASFEGLTDFYYALNSEGKMVPVKEVGWGDEDDSVTHIMLMFSSSYSGAYKGALGNTFWVDDISLVYDK